MFFIHRPEYYRKSGVDSEGNDIRQIAEFIIAKHRSGSTDDVKLRFVKQYARFENWDENNLVEESYESSAPPVQDTEFYSTDNQEAPF